MAAGAVCPSGPHLWYCSLENKLSHFRLGQIGGVDGDDCDVWILVRPLEGAVDFQAIFIVSRHGRDTCMAGWGVGREQVSIDTSRTRNENITPTTPVGNEWVGKGKHGTNEMHGAPTCGSVVKQGL